MPPERARRQQPVSCQYCRGRKLRCDRQLPCSNCRHREIACTYASQRAAVDAFGGSVEAVAASTRQDDLISLRAENEAIRVRLAAIERVLFESDLGKSSSPDSATALGLKHPSVLPTLLPASPESETVVAWTADSQWLERMGAQNIARTSSLVVLPSVSVLHLRGIFTTKFQTASASDPILLPSLDEASRLFAMYLERLDTVQHILYRPHVSEAIVRLYHQIQDSQPYKYSHLALLLAILANVAETCDYGPREDDLFPNPHVAHELATYWLKGSLDVLEIIWRSQIPDLETVQAISIMIFQLYHTESFSSRSRLLHALAISLAKDIGLHKTDVIPLVDGASQEQIIEREMCRRNWWHLTAIDWGLSLSSGSHEGTYSISPLHMQVKRPRNVTNDDLATKPADFERPTAEPTSIGYYLHCIRISEACREVADVTWSLVGTDVDDDLYQSAILPLDKKFEDLLATTPAFLKIDCPSLGDHAPSARWTMQRNFTYLIIQARRCRLHLPYSMRVERHQSYQRSRDICLNASRNILKLRDCAPAGELNSATGGNAARTLGVLPHFFFATTILVMDFCFNQDTVDKAERKAEIRSACEIFENAKPSASLFLDALKAVMRKHKMHLKGIAPQSAANALPHGGNSVDTMRDQGNIVENENPVPNAEIDLDLNELWQSYLDADPPGLQDWNAIFAHLDAGVQ